MFYSKSFKFIFLNFLYVKALNLFLIFGKCFIVKALNLVLNVL